MKKGLTVSKADEQPYPRLGLLLDFSIRKTGKGQIDDLVERLRWQMSTVDDDNDDDEEMEEQGVSSHLFIFHEALKDLEERVQTSIDVRKKEWRSAIRKILNDLSHIDRYEQSDGEKGHSVSSLIVIAALEEALQAKAEEHKLYKVEPLQKMYGTPYASKYLWADGEDLQEVFSSLDADDFELGRMFDIQESPLNKDAAPLFLEKTKICLQRLQAYLAKGYKPSEMLIDVIADRTQADREQVRREKIAEAEALAASLDPPGWDPFMDEHVRNVLSFLRKDAKNGNAKDLEEAENYLEDIVRTLKAIVGYEKLLDDAEGMSMDQLYVERGLGESGYPSWDLEPRNIIFGGCEAETGIPLFTVIDQWLEDGEIDHKRRTHGGGGGTLRMGP